MASDFLTRLCNLGTRLRQWWHDSAPITQRDFDDYVRHQADVIRRLWTRVDALEYSAELAGLDGFANKPKLEAPRTYRKWDDIKHKPTKVKAEAKRARHKS